MDAFDPDLLRTFIAFVETGSLSRAAVIVGRTPSAVTAQMRRLEEIVGEPLLAAAGRGRVLTPAGEDMVGHSRRILAAHRDAWLSMRGARADGRVRLGATQDFAEDGLAPPLRRFVETHPRVRLDLRIGRTIELADAYERDEVDIVVSMRRSPQPDEIGVFREPMVWLASASGLGGSADELPLALLDPPCGFRAAAIAALDAAGRAYRIAAASASLAGAATAVLGGFAVMPRTRRMIRPGLGLAPSELDLPALPAAEFAIRARVDAEPAARDLATLLASEWPFGAV
jgi:DNA-binding transcriptional LysR family regulator